MLQGEVLVGEFFSVDRLASGAVVLGKVTTLAHELLTFKRTSVIEQRSSLIERRTGITRWKLDPEKEKQHWEKK